MIMGVRVRKASAKLKSERHEGRVSAKLRKSVWNGVKPGVARSTSDTGRGTLFVCDWKRRVLGAAPGNSGILGSNGIVHTQAVTKRIDDRQAQAGGRRDPISVEDGQKLYK